MGEATGGKTRSEPSLDLRPGESVLTFYYWKEGKKSTFFNAV